MRKRLKIIGLILLGLLIVGQLIPVSLPETTTDPGPDALTASGSTTPEVVALLKQSCYDCHSSQTRYPWYSHVAPVSWLVISDVKEGRDEINFSEWNALPKRRRFRKLGDIKEQLEKKEMPLGIYVVMHGEARLSDEQRKMLIDWTEAASQELLGN